MVKSVTDDNNPKVEDKGDRVITGVLKPLTLVPGG